MTTAIPKLIHLNVNAAQELSTVACALILSICSVFEVVLVFCFGSSTDDTFVFCVFPLWKIKDTFDGSRDCLHSW